MNAFRNIGKRLARIFHENFSATLRYLIKAVKVDDNDNFQGLKFPGQLFEN
jgi:hypothetical protein